MKLETKTCNGYEVPVYTLHTAVIGSGAAGLNAALCLHRYGITDAAVFTEGVRQGTSRNTGSDKQTYYKLSLAGESGDSPRKMAKTLFDGGCVDGDTALMEAATSAESFFHLCQIGVCFPHNEFGEYAGYQTDHDETMRATSAGPLTSREMYDCLLREVKQKEIPVIDQMQAIRLLVEDGRVYGFLALDKTAQGDPNRRLVLVNCVNVILATGGPAGLYQMSVYPQSQTGATGLALEAGALGKNVTEWQYGIASLKFRWNLSGSYQQVLPCYVSTDPDGNDARDFLAEGFAGANETLLNDIFLKGYQWPFDPEKTDALGSSYLDMLVYRETVLRGRRVFLDYRRNPPQLLKNGKPDFSRVSQEVYRYLENSHAMQDTPLARLLAMNRPAYELYLSHGIDLAKEPLEIGVCAQHNNGGLAADCNWQSNIQGLFPIGEVNGSHGIRRPGGSALNAGQAGGLAAARYLASSEQREPLSAQIFLQRAEKTHAWAAALCTKLLANRGTPNLTALRGQMAWRMSAYGAFIRETEKLEQALEQAREQLAAFETQSVLPSASGLFYALKTRELLICQIAYLSAMLDYDRRGGQSRGSYLVLRNGGAYEAMGLSYQLDLGAHAGEVQLVAYQEGRCTCSYRPVRPIPDPELWFERVYVRSRTLCGI